VTIYYRRMREELDTYRLRVELAKINRSRQWLAEKIGYTRQYVYYLVKNKSIKHVEKMANALGLDPKDLIK
jgi:hypothetical protein